MVKGPNDLGKLTESDKDSVNKLEKEIDAYLVQNYSGGKEIHIPIKTNPDFKIKEAIKSRYKSAGWKTVKFEYEYDKQKGKLNYLKLSKKEEHIYRSSSGSSGYGCDEHYPSSSDTYWH